MIRKIITVLTVVVMVSSVVAPFAGVAGAQQSAPSGMVGVPSTNVAPVTIGDSYPGGVERTTLTTAASDWSVQSSEHAGDLEVAVGELDGSLALVFTDDVNHAGREVAVDATTLANAVGERPGLAYGLHENGSRWTAPITYENGHAVFDVPEFSSNTVTFEGTVGITATPASSGSSYSYDLDTDSASNYTIDITGRTNSQWDNVTHTNTGTSSSQSISVGGNVDPAGPSTNGNPTVEVSMPIEEVGTVTDAVDLATVQTVAQKGNYSYLASRDNNHLAVVDTTDPSNPSVVGTVSDTALGDATDLATDGSYVYAAARGANEMVVVDVTTPSSPAVAGRIDFGSGSKPNSLSLDSANSKVHLSGDLNDQLWIVDVSTPSSPTQDSNISPADFAGPRGSTLVGNYLFVTQTDSDSLVAVDVTDTTTPAVAGSVTDSTALNVSWDVTAGPNGNYAYVAARGTDRVATVDISTPSTPSVVTSVTGPEVSGTMRNIASAGDYVYTADSANNNYAIINATDPTMTTITDGATLGSAWDITTGANRVYVGGGDSLRVLTPHESVSSLSVADDTTASASFGYVETGDVVTRELQLSSSSTSLSWSGTGDPIDSTTRLQEQTLTENPVVETNGQTTSYSGMVSEGTTVSLSTNTSWLNLAGTNRVNVTVADSLSADAPTGQARLEYSHTASDAQSITYEGEAYSERYNVSKQFASDQTGATLTIPFETTVVDVRNLETRTNGGTWSTVASSDYSLTGTELTVQLGSVTAGDTVDVRTTGSKVQVTNGSITVTDPTVLDDPLSTKLRIDSYSSGFTIDVNATAYNDALHYTHSESWTNAQSYASVSADNAQSIRMPKAGAGETTRLATIPLAVQPTGGNYDVRVSSAGAEPELQVRDTTTADSADLVWKDTDSGNTYQLYSLSADEERDRATAQSPVTLTHSGISELLVIYDLGGGSGGGDGGGGGGAKSSSVTIAGLQPVMLIGAAVAGLALLFIVSRRYGDGSLSDTALFGAGAAIIAIVAVQALAPEILAQAIGAAIQDAGPLIVLGLIAAVIIWLRQRGDDVTLNFRGGN